MSATVADVHAEHEHHGPVSGWRRWLYATNHKDIGTMYLIFSLLMFFTGGIMALVVRTGSSCLPSVDCSAYLLSFLIPLYTYFHPKSLLL